MIDMWLPTREDRKPRIQNKIMHFIYPKSVYKRSHTQENETGSYPRFLDID